MHIKRIIKTKFQEKAYGPFAKGLLSCPLPTFYADKLNLNIENCSLFRFFSCLFGEGQPSILGSIAIHFVVFPGALNLMPLSLSQKQVSETWNILYFSNFWQQQRSYAAKHTRQNLPCHWIRSQVPRQILPIHASFNNCTKVWSDLSNLGFQDPIFPEVSPLLFLFFLLSI